LVLFGAGTTSHIQRALRELSEGFDELTEGKYTILVVGLRDNSVAFYHNGISTSGATSSSTDLHNGPPLRRYTHCKTVLRPANEKGNRTSSPSSA